MIRSVGKKRVVFFLSIGLSVISSIAADYVQANEYESRLRQAEQISQQLVKPIVAVFDLHSNTDLKKMTLELIKVTKDSKIHGILLWIDSNGGGAGISSSVHDTLLRVGKFKPILALVRGNALSAGYHMATAAHYIFAHSASDIGAIGTVYTVERYKNAIIQKNDLEADLDVTLFTAGKYKALGHPYRDDLTDDEKKEIQEKLDVVNNVFITDVARNRDLDITKIDQWAEGRTFTAHEAVGLGLIDELGTAFEAEAKMIELIRAKNPDKLVKGDVEYIFFDCVAPAPSK